MGSQSNFDYNLPVNLYSRKKMVWYEDMDELLFFGGNTALVTFNVTTWTVGTFTTVTCTVVQPTVFSAKAP